MLIVPYQHTQPVGIFGGQCVHAHTTCIHYIGSSGNALGFQHAEHLQRIAIWR